MSYELGNVLMFALGIGLLYAALLIRRGARRWWVLRYRDYRLPLTHRNGAFVLLPAGVVCVAVPLGNLAYPHRQEVWAGLVLILAGLTALIAFVTAIAWLYSPPEIAKPPWLRQQEAASGVAIDPDPRARLLERLWIAAIFAPLGLAAVVLLVRLLFG